MLLWQVESAVILWLGTKNEIDHASETPPDSDVTLVRLTPASEVVLELPYSGLSSGSGRRAS